LTGSVHDVTSINARTSQIEKYTQQYYGSKASAPFVGDHRIVDNRARIGLFLSGGLLVQRVVIHEAGHAAACLMFGIPIIKVSIVDMPPCILRLARRPNF
jgi:hypothetical protein